MRTTLFFTLLVCYVRLGSTAKETKLNDGLLSIQTKKLQSQIFKTKKETLAYVDANTCFPPKTVDIGFKHMGVGLGHFDPQSDSSESACEQYCSSYFPRCLTYNYESSTMTCELIFKLDTFVAEPGWTTALLKFKGGDPCNEVNFIRDYHRTGSDYKILDPGEVTSPVECCKRCTAETSAGCVAWDYNSGNQKCFLKNATPSLDSAVKPGVLWTGLGCGSSSQI